MKKFTANYALTNPNFVIQNLVENPIKSDYLPLLYVLKNILQRGFPTALSENLQNKLGKLHKREDFKEPFLFVNTETPKWLNTIKGDTQNNYFPAKDFFEKEIPRHFGDFAFVQSLILPEVEINEVVGEYNKIFVNQQVDFFLPQAKLVIEIDGQQHKRDDVTRVNDTRRDDYLILKGIQVIRITTDELRNGTFQTKIDVILQRLSLYEKNLLLYKKAFQKGIENSISQEEIQNKLLPTAIMRFQILLIELLVNNYLTFDDKWNFNIFAKEDVGNFAELAIEDFLIWFDNLCKLKKLPFEKPDFEIKITHQKTDFQLSTKTINIDFSLFERWTDQNTIVSEDLILVRTDYFGTEKNYFSVSTAEPINYQVTDSDKPVLEFFLLNIFDKPSFREGQFPIIANALNRKDTIGLLPTGGGKSLCYQLPCLLQPSVNFIVCPIKSLMYDQYQNLNNALITNTNFITGDLPAEERAKIQTEFAEGKYLFVWISPERFQIPTFRDYLASLNTNLSVAYAVVDEVHCLSEWGHDFRTSYLNLAKTIEKYCPKANFIGLTATASVNVLKDIKVEFARQRKRLDDDNIKSLLDYSRKELNFDIVIDEDNKEKVIQEKLQEIKDSQGFFETDKKAGLVFTPYVNGEYGCYDLSNNLNLKFGGKVNWYSGEVPTKSIYIDVTNDESNNRDVLREIIKNKVVELNPDFTERELSEILIDNRSPKIYPNKYNLAMKRVLIRQIPVINETHFKAHKDKVQKNFKSNAFPLMVATKAFGMGIDKPNIEYTFHYGLPSSIEALYQEAGRAGRWLDKEKKAKCTVLYSIETVDLKLINELFNKDTSFGKMKEICENVGKEGKDIFRQLFLFLQGQHDIEEDFIIISFIVDTYFLANGRKQIFWNNAITSLTSYSRAKLEKPIYGNEQNLQKAIYRLSLLGIVKDWTVDFKNRFYEVEFLTVEDSRIQNALSEYILKYEPNINLAQELHELNRQTVREKCIEFLLKWTFENIAYNRKQSLKTLADWCSDFAEIGNEAFKKRIDNYFRFSETTFVFQHIAENPKDFEKWFEVFNRVDQNELKEEIITFIPTIENEQEKKMELERLRDSLSRILESTRNSTGLNLVSGLIRLFLNDFEDSDGRVRFDSALENIRLEFSIDAQIQIVNRIISIGHHLEENTKVALCYSIDKYYPNSLEKLAETYGLYYLLNDTLSKQLNKLKSINHRLYEQFTEIQ
jgi:ATP-dependent DNA helicase RecQ